MSLAGEKRYRVEILLLFHIQNEAIPSEVERLRDFSDSLDFPKAETEDDSEMDDARVSGDESVNVELISESELLPDEEQPKDPWADVFAVEDMSAVMQDAWRRLRLSAPFRPEQYLSWEQSADEPFPSLRIHDLEVVLIDDPYADLREIDAIAPGLPDPTLFYRIDGTVMLRRSRFLHLDLDLELRQAVFAQQALPLLPILNSGSAATESELPVPTSFLIHALKQSRQVKSQRMEYFDSPVLGVLAWITPFEIEDEPESQDQ